MTLDDYLDMRQPAGAMNAREFRLIGVAWPPQPGWRMAKGTMAVSKTMLEELNAAHGAEQAPVPYGPSGKHHRRRALPERIDFSRT
ncbi:hypothetical protein G3A43_09290 [Paraburkholderia aspalathi]|nr:hypothetical protein [Paraburkholderia aspalathi]MBK3780419.1 hypothetical protein [Paraburkholderia aspalathi]